MFCPQVDFASTSLADILDRLTVRSIAGIRGAAQALHETALSIANLRTAACANIASKDPMIDGEGHSHFTADTGVPLRKRTFLVQP